MNWWDDPDVAQTATAIAKRFRGYVEAEDVKSVLVLWCLENESTAEKVWAGPRWFKQRRLWTIAQRFARKEKAQAVGHEIEDEFFYSPAVVKHLLPDVFDDTATKPENGIASTPAKSSLNSGHNSEWETLVADVRRAIQLMSNADIDLLWHLYSANGMALTAYAEYMGHDYRWGIRAERRAMRRLLDLLGGTTPWAEDITQEPQKPASDQRRDEKTPEAIVG